MKSVSARNCAALTACTGLRLPARPARARTVCVLEFRLEARVPDTVRDNPALNRFELDVEGHTAAAYYRRAPGVVTFTHTEVPPELSGRGIGSQLVRGALEAVRAQ